MAARHQSSLLVRNIHTHGWGGLMSVASCTDAHYSAHSAGMPSWRLPQGHKPPRPGKPAGNMIWLLPWPCFSSADQIIIVRSSAATMLGSPNALQSLSAAMPFEVLDSLMQPGISVHMQPLINPSTPPSSAGQQQATSKRLQGRAGAAPAPCSFSTTFT
jgi:hypothetical protein